MRDAELVKAFAGVRGPADSLPYHEERESPHATTLGIEGALTDRDWKEVAKSERLSLLIQVEMLGKENF